MQKRLLYLAGSVAILSGVGCADATAPNVQGGTHNLAIVVPQLNAPVAAGMRAPGVSAMVVPPDSSGDGSSAPDYNAVSSFVDKWTDAGFVAGGDAFSQAYMEFWATDYDQTTTVYLDYQNSPLDHRDGHDADGFWWPFSSHTATTNATIAAGGSCDYGASGQSTHHIWNQALMPDGTYMHWSDKTATTSKSRVSQPPCQMQDTTVDYGSTGGTESTDSGGTIYIICYWTNYYEDGVLVQHDDDGCQVLG